MVNRRQFVKTVGLGALAGAGMEVIGPKVAAAQSDGNADKSKVARLLPGCCAYSYDEELSHARMTLEDFILKAVDLGVISVDMTVYYLKSTDPEYLHGLRHLAYQHGIVFSGVSCGSSMVQADAVKRANTLSEMKKWVDVTNDLGASHLRVFAGELPPGVKLAEATDWVVESLKAAADYSAKKGITLGLEDHEGVTQTADVCLEIMHRVNSPYAGINLDITNFIASPAQDAYAQIAACIPYATGNIHIRDHFYDHTAVDMDRVWKMLAKAGHQGYVSAEYEASFPDSLPCTTGVPKLIDEIKVLCNKYSSI
jgi:sugar phosphate isomerase/epimerase